MEMNFTPKDALLVIDVQIDFCPGGNLPIRDGDKVVEIINPLIKEAQKKGTYIFLSRDFHPRLHPSFKENGGPWPTHCVQDTHGAMFHPHLIVPEKAIIVSKGTRFDKDQYSAFDDTGLETILRKLNINRVFIAGLALDVCVKETALDSIKHGFTTILIKEGTRPVDQESGEKAISLMKQKGIQII